MSVPTPTPAGQAIIDKWADYFNYDNTTHETDTLNFRAKLQQWCQMVDLKQKGNEVLLMLFWTMLVIGGNDPKEGLAGDGSSVTKNQENSLIEVGKEMNYSTAYRDAGSEIKDQIVNPTGDKSGVATVESDLYYIDQYRSGDKFNDWAPVIFNNSDDTFKTAENDITSVLAKIDPSGAVPPGPGYAYSSFADLVKQAKTVSPGTTNDASNDLQTFMNGADGILSAVGVQQNVLGATMQDTEANYKSVLSSDTQGVNSIFSIIEFAIQHFISS